ncbi:MAG TPA: GDSL-type esterase/lipase family protein [Thermoanaerobaculia bacterium]|nr:GDSL-type esterase/lipase family protein [Thermoanaerobaculia bacterium]
MVSVLALVTFAAGFYSFLRGDTGTPVDLLPRRVAAAPAAQQSVITPIILGDSLARGTGDQAGLGIGGRLDQELRRRNIRANHTVNIAVNGARTPDLLRQLDSPNVQTILGQSNVIIVSIGGNDLWGGTDWRTATRSNPEAVMTGVLDRIETIVRAIRADNPRARVFIIGLYNPFVSTPAGPQLTPLVNRWNAKLIEGFSNDPNVTIVQTSDIFASHDRLSLDRFHPGDEGYALIARRIADAI